jgi:hypothetical protein
MVKGKSIITNFGCSEHCWYCVFKKHSLCHVRLGTNWDKLTQFIAKDNIKRKVSVSGGGDPLFKLKDNYSWWEKLFAICEQHNILIDVHSRVPTQDTNFLSKINRFCFSSDYPEEAYICWLSSHVKTRIVHVVTNATNNTKVNAYVELAEKTGCQLSLKELDWVSGDKLFKNMTSKYPQVYNIPLDDYNEYFMPDNSIQYKFKY